jgi:hypothetical protein
MATIQEIQDKLNIVVGDRDIQEGMCKPMKNRYYNINNDYLVVEFKHDKHMVFSNDAKTRELLSNFVWCMRPDGYPFNFNVKRFHQNYLDYEDGLVVDHKNRLKYDNRLSNLRIVTVQQNMRNRTKQSNNRSGKQGVSYQSDRQTWIAFIYDNNNQIIRKGFPLRLHGDDAKRLAIEQRLAWEREFNYTGE